MGVIGRRYPIRGDCHAAPDGVTESRDKLSEGTHRFGVEAVQPPYAKYFVEPGRLRAVFVGSDERFDRLKQHLGAGKSVGFRRRHYRRIRSAPALDAGRVRHILMDRGECGCIREVRDTGKRRAEVGQVRPQRLAGGARSGHVRIAEL